VRSYTSCEVWPFTSRFIFSELKKELAERFSLRKSFAFVNIFLQKEDFTKLDLGLIKIVG